MLNTKKFILNSYTGENKFSAISKVLIFFMALIVIVYYINSINAIQTLNDLTNIFISSFPVTMFLFLCFGSYSKSWNPFRLGIAIGGFIILLAMVLSQVYFGLIGIVSILLSLAGWHYYIQVPCDKYNEALFSEKKRIIAALSESIS